jgi:hypothetical protein
MGMTDEITELENSLKGMDKLLVQSSKDAMVLKSSLKGINTLVSGKNYEIISRFLSGTGAWKVLNKAKATVLTMIQLVSIQERAALQDNLRMKEMAKIIKERKELLKLEAQFKKASVNMDKEAIEKLKEKSNVFAAISLEVGDEKAIAQILKRIGKSKGLLDKILGKGKVSGKTIVEDPTSKSILESTFLQTAALTAGFMLNQKFLKQMATSSTEVSKFASEQNAKIAELTKVFGTENKALKEDFTKKAEYESKLLEYLSKETGFNLTDKNMVGGGAGEKSIAAIQVTTEQAKQMLEDNARLFANISLNPEKLLSKGMDYLKEVTDLEEESYKNRIEAIKKNKKTFSAANDYVDSLLDNIDPTTKKFISDKERYKKLADIAPREGRRNYETGRFQKGAGRFRKINPEFKKLVDDAKALQATFDSEKSKRRDKRISGMKRAFGFGKTDEEKETEAQKFASRRKTFKKLYQRPILRIRESIQENGGVFSAVKEWALDGGAKLVEFTGKLLMFAKKAFVTIGLALLTLFLLYRAFKSAGVREKLGEIWEQTKSLFTMMVLPFLELVASGIGDIVTGFQEGKFFLVIEGLLKILGGIVMASLALLSLALIVVLKLIHAGIMGIAAWVKKSSGDTKMLVAKVMYIIAGIAVLAAFFFGLPALIVAGIALAIAYAFEKFSFFADGGVTTGGLSVVGEKGPELVKLPTGSRVYSNADSGKMVAANAASSGGNTINVHVNGRVGASDTEIRDIANKVAKEINIRMNQTSSTVSMV